MSTKEDDVRKPKTTFDGEYPYVQSFQSTGGHTIILDSTPKKETIRVSHGGDTNPGSYMEWSVNGKFVQAIRDNSFNYTKGGSTSTTDKGSDAKTGGHSRANVDGGSHTEQGQNSSAATNGSTTKVSKGVDDSFVVNSSPGGDSDSVTQGDVSSKHTGNSHKAIEGDNVDYTNGNRIISTKGEAFEDVQGGNKSIVVSGTLKLQSDTQIILEVGSSKIIIGPNDIIISAAGKVDIKAGDDVITKGSTTKIQGGGAAAPPTTFS